MVNLLKGLKLLFSQIQWELPAFQLHSYEKNIERKGESIPCNSIDNLPIQRQLDAKYWRTTAGYGLATFLHFAGYSEEAQQRHVAFFNDVVAPALGQKPHTSSPHGQWPSFMTDDGTPLEISWDWGFDGQQATIRYSIEPIGPEAGSSLDPLNKYASSRFLQNMRELLPEADWQWSEHFQKELCVFNESLEHDNEAHKSRFFAAYDLDGSINTMKVYYFPAFKANESGQSKIDVLSSAITRLPSYAPCEFSAFELLCNYINASSVDGSLEVEILAVDCVKPQHTRLKIYVRSRQTSLESVRSIVTLGGILASPEMDQSLDKFGSLWSSLFSSTYSEPVGTSSDNHRTAGILYNFEVRAGSLLPVPKVYIPVRHYTRSDEHVMGALGKYIRESQKDDAMFAGYTKAMTKLL